MMELRDFIKFFTFTEPDRSRVVLGTDTRLNPLTHRAQLKEDAAGEYPTADDLYVKTWVANPLAVREWRGFEADVIHKRIDNEQVTSAGFRLSDGTDEFYWDGASWVTGVNWNTEIEVADHISAFPATSRKLQVIVNLKTTNKLVTPELVGIRVLYGALLDSEIEDMVLRSFVPLLRSAVRSVTRLIAAKNGSNNTVSMDDYRLDGDYRVIDVDAVFNHTDDPDHNQDLYESHTTRSVPDDPRHDGTVDVITLNALVTAGKSLWLRLLVEPVVAIETSRDYYEVAHLPCLVIENISFLGAVLRKTEDYVGNKGSGLARILPGPRQGTLEISLAGITDKIVDGMRLSSAVSRFFGERPLISSTGLDERYRLRLVDPHGSSSSPNAEDIRTWRKVFRIENFCTWERAAEDGFLVRHLKFRGSLQVTIG